MAKETPNEKRLKKEKELDKLNSLGLIDQRKGFFRDKKGDYGTSLSKGAEYAGKEASKKALEESSPLVFEPKMRLKTRGETSQEMLKAQRQAEREAAAEERRETRGLKKGGMVKSSASKRADGCAVKGKTKGKMV
jgi:hypothetical protein